MGDNSVEAEDGKVENPPQEDAPADGPKWEKSSIHDLLKIILLYTVVIEKDNKKERKGPRT